MRSLYRTLGRSALRAIALACLAVAVTGMSYGAVAVGRGFPLWVPMATSLLVVAGSAEFLFVGIVGAGGNPVAAVLAGLLVNARHVPFGLSLGPFPGRRPLRALAAHCTNDESVVFALSQRDPARRRAAFWACGLGVLLTWPPGVLLGALIGDAVGDTRAFGLDAVFPAILTALILPSLRERTTRRAALTGAAVALAATPFLPTGLPVLLSLAGLVCARPRTPDEPATPKEGLG
ncbi:AzlC family ABC transporter permease [Streptomyces sp. NPDC059740]|uniref:AzlC family ABC transporter permease n=1 Tax=Streptomyces sp. NPDC059740 TaxID=3346926 RepID=UPI003667C920